MQDASYFAGSVFYLVGALRDGGWLWWAPEQGRCAAVPNPCQAGLCPAAWGPEASWDDVEDAGSVAATGAGKEPSTGEPIRLFTHPGAGNSKRSTHLFTMRELTRGPAAADAAGQRYGEPSRSASYSSDPTAEAHPSGAQ